jgi:anti-sigma regulatory factor (Ser/Thr protein kinase)
MTLHLEIHCDHIVDFYSRDDEIVGRVGVFLADGLHRGEPTLCLATTELSSKIDAWLSDEGFDVAQLQSSGQLVCLDAAQVLEQISTNQRVDEYKFRSLIVPIVARMVAGGKAPRAFGELVNILWGRGQVNEAVKLELLWNEVLRSYCLSLYCGYRVDPDNAEPDGIDAIHDAHSRVITTTPPVAERDQRTEFPGRPSSIGAARQFAREVFGGWSLDGHSDVGLLVVSELAANAVMHAQSDFELRLLHTGTAVRISVRDNSPGMPEPRQFVTNSTSGRGLAMIAEFSDRWGCESRAGGKEVWVELIV